MFTTGRIFLDWNTHLMEGNFRLITEVSSGGGTFPFRPSRAIDGQRGKRKKKKAIVNSLNHALQLLAFHRQRDCFPFLYGQPLAVG